MTERTSVTERVANEAAILVGFGGREIVVGHAIVSAGASIWYVPERSDLVYVDSAGRPPASSMR